MEGFLDTLPLNQILVFTLLSFIIIINKRLFVTAAAMKNTTLPSSPRKLPIIGNLHQLGTFPHRSLQSLSNQYGDLMLLHLGTKPTLVVSSPDGAEEIMKTHDIIFANRPYSKIASLSVYDGKDIAFSKYGEYWRKIKMICVLHMLSNKKVRSFRKIREEEVELMVERITKKSSTPNVPLNLSESITKMASDVVFRVAFGKKYEEENVGSLLGELVEALGSFSIGMFIPWLSWIDEFSGVLRNARRTASVFNLFIRNRIDEHMNDFENKRKGEDDQTTQDDFVDILLEIQRNDSSIDMYTVHALLVDMVAGGIETTATLLEWTMLELLTHPQVMKRLQEEVRGFLREKTIIDEDDLKDMIYLKAVIKEALRLHPPLPFLLFREASRDVKVRNHDISAGTQVIINAWAIQRHPAYWEEAEEFRPERFLGSSLGNEFGYVPFGAGKRVCPGIAFARVEAEVALANLVGWFDWTLPDGQVNEESLMAERFGTSLRRRDPLVAIPTPYSNHSKKQCKDI